jgi:aspartate oxidase
MKAVPELGSSFKMDPYRRSGKEGAFEFKEREDLIKHNTQKDLVIQRSEKGLKRLISILDTCREEIESRGWNRTEELRPFTMVHGMAELGILIARQALLRKEGLGSHSRDDTGQKESSIPGKQPAAFQGEDLNEPIDTMRTRAPDAGSYHAGENHL